MKDRLSRLESQCAARGEQAPPGMAAVLMYAIAVRLGGLSQTQDNEMPHVRDEISDGLARGLGYRDFAEMDRQAAKDMAAWGTRMEEGVTALLRTAGIDRYRATDAELFGGLVRILDEAEAGIGGRHLGWQDMGERLDDWIRFAGLSPETIRAAAQA